MAGARTRATDAAAARLRQQMARLGIDVRTTRGGLGWTQSHFSRRAGVAHASVSRLEAGDVHLTIRIVTRIVAALGQEIGIRLFPGDGVGLRDSGQLSLAQALCGVAHRTWRPVLEAPISPNSRRAADMLLRGTRGAIHIELESNLVDFQAQLRNGQLKRDALQHLIGQPISFVLALRDSRHNRAAAGAHLGVIRAALPAQSREVMNAIRSGTHLTRDGLLWLRPNHSHRSG
jgi:transcriptional regulator with XRE-family HTH domain